MAGRGGTAGTRVRLWAGVGLAIAVALLARPDEAAARGGETGAGPAVARLAAGAGSRRTAARLPASSAMPVGEWRLPPAGYLDYCLRFRGRDRGCAL